MQHIQNTRAFSNSKLAQLSVFYIFFGCYEKKFTGRRIRVCRKNDEKKIGIGCSQPPKFIQRATSKEFFPRLVDEFIENVDSVSTTNYESTEHSQLSIQGPRIRNELATNTHHTTQ